MAAKKVSVATGPGCARSLTGSRGITLLELVLVLAIAGILLSLAIPSYQRYVQRGQRVEAIRLLLATAACQERIRSATGSYDTLRCGEVFNTEYYVLSIEPQGDPASLEFHITATPKRRSASDSCGSLSLDQAGTRGIDGSPDKLSACWGGR